MSREDGSRGSKPGALGSWRLGLLCGQGERPARLRCGTAPVYGSAMQVPEQAGPLSLAAEGGCFVWNRKYNTIVFT